MCYPILFPVLLWDIKGTELHHCSKVADITYLDASVETKMSFYGA